MAIPVVGPSASSWACCADRYATRDAQQWIAVVPCWRGRGSAHRDSENLSARSAGITAVADERTPPPNTRPVVFALGSVVSSPRSCCCRTCAGATHAAAGPSRSSRTCMWHQPWWRSRLLTFYPITLRNLAGVHRTPIRAHLGDEAVHRALQTSYTVLTSPGIVRVTLFTTRVGGEQRDLPRVLRPGVGRRAQSFRPQGQNVLPDDTVIALGDSGLYLDPRLERHVAARRPYQCGTRHQHRFLRGRNFGSVCP